MFEGEPVLGFGIGIAECGEYEKVAVLGHGERLYVHGAEIVWNLLLIRCERLVREGRGNGGELALLGDVLAEMRIDAGQESIGGCTLREEIDRLVGDGGNTCEPEFGVLCGDKGKRRGSLDDDVRLARLCVRSSNIDGVRPVFERRSLVALVDKFGEARVLRILSRRGRRRVPGCERVARGGERRDGEHGKGQLTE